MTDEPTERVLVTVRDDGLSRLPEVVAGLRAAGLRVDQVLDSVGVVVGEVPVGTAAALGEVDGVEAIEPDGVIQLDDPGSEVQ